MALVYNEVTGDFDDVQVPPIIRLFKIQQSSPIYEGDEVTLIWQVDNANHVFINDEEQTESSKAIQISEAGSIQFKLKATNEDGVSERHIDIESIRRPAFSIYTSASVLHKGIGEKLVFRFSVENAKDLKLHHNNQSENLPLNGELTFTPTDDTQFDFDAEGLEGGRRFHHIVPIQVREAAKIIFKASRQFSYPNLPIILSWGVENAVNVSLDNFGNQPNEGQLEVTPGTDTTYVLRMTDAFDDIQRTLTIKMLPLPVIRQLLVPAPQIEENLAISYIPPQVNLKIPIPTFESPLVRINIPKVPTLKDSPFYVNKIQYINQRKHIKNPFKTLYSYFFHK
ncbi:MAG: hypothetical protein NC230_06335 [Bacteroides sp.]|nr:hypothetical protein [Bacteroides sp.]